MAIMEDAGIGTKAGSVTFSLPVMDRVDMHLAEENDDEKVKRFHDPKKTMDLPIVFLN